MSWRTLVLALCFAVPAAAQEDDEEVVAGLSQSRISISANFDGSEILVFGAVKRESPIRSQPPLGVIVAVVGPSGAVTVRRKDRLAGIWVNQNSVEVDAAPSFYAVATSAPLEDILNDTEDLRNRISIRRAIRTVGAAGLVEDPTNFTDALIRIRKGAGLYQMNPGTVEITESTLFNTSISLPANLTEGEYLARIFLTRGGRVVTEHRTEIYVRKVGLERLLYNLAHEQPLIYGLLSLALAAIAGWGASAAFRWLR
ncbi:conserved hypothetical protein [Tranquillimonas rosea]|uniref:TIGR02186 family protein n=1 Tax=Tranquillimonas rosea TaxID=641238 RepID=A0A1H9SB84_9RHOB|nr:TIGR02186 family protein [Tranquillimonas rosea]SER82188.1 conserved hypothetical protein [Tranquillimonas rosea]